MGKYLMLFWRGEGGGQPVRPVPLIKRPFSIEYHPCTLKKGQRGKEKGRRGRYWRVRGGWKLNKIICHLFTAVRQFPPKKYFCQNIKAKQDSTFRTGNLLRKRKSIDNKKYCRTILISFSSSNSFEQKRFYLICPK